MHLLEKQNLPLTLTKYPIYSGNEPQNLIHHKSNKILPVVLQTLPNILKEGEGGRIGELGRKGRNGESEIWWSQKRIHRPSKNSQMKIY